jgi:hypothetical protein
VKPPRPFGRGFFLPAALRVRGACRSIRMMNILCMGPFPLSLDEGGFCLGVLVRVAAALGSVQQPVAQKLILGY